jgi:hypothetical protein
MMDIKYDGEDGTNNIYQLGDSLHVATRFERVFLIELT